MGKNFGISLDCDYIYSNLYNPTEKLFVSRYALGNAYFLYQLTLLPLTDLTHTKHK